MPGDRAPVTLRTVLVSHLSEDEVQACSRLTLPKGLMRDRLHSIRRGLQPHVRNLWMLRRLETETVVLAELESGELAGWALVMCANTRVAPQVYLYVDEPHRRRGIATQLMDIVSARWPDIQIHPWDEVSSAFYAAYGHDLQHHWMSEDRPQRTAAPADRVRS